jgi:hypothetical protein
MPVFYAGKVGFVQSAARKRPSQPAACRFTIAPLQNFAPFELFDPEDNSYRFPRIRAKWRGSLYNVKGRFALESLS